MKELIVTRLSHSFALWKGLQPSRKLLALLPKFRFEIVTDTCEVLGESVAIL